jgi:hypothetical protein
MARGRWLVTALVCAFGATASATVTPAPPAEPGGFRLSPRPKIVEVYGDSTSFRAHIDRFFTLAAEMQATRVRFSRDVQLVLATLAATQPGGRKKCPLDAVAPPVARAYALGDAYQAQGRELEGHHLQIENLYALGEGAGLTPDYRWRVLEARRQYPALLRDWREMRTAFSRELVAELAFAGCSDLPGLIERGDTLSGGQAAPADATAVLPLAAQPRLRVNPRDVPPVPSTAPVVTFAVDNLACPAAVRLVIDDDALGQIAGGARIAFRTAAGRHSLCLLTSPTSTCGDPGTKRTAYIHEGWAITLRCD